jgi:tetratricopeptide (TPR) repeat protein
VNLVLAFVLALEVPFVAQKDNYCGPAALAMVANYYGHPVTQDEIAGAIYLPEIRGTLTADLAGYAQRFNLWTRQYQGTRADLHEKLSAGIPMIVLGKVGSQFHYFVVLHYRGDELIVHSDTRPYLHIREDDFLRWWNRADRWTLLVCPPEKAAWQLSADEHNDLGVFLERAGKYAAATGHYREATAHDAGNSYFQMNLGNALLRQKLYAEAATVFAKACDNPDALNNLAYAYGELNANLDEAVALSDRAIKLQPSHRAYYLDTQAGILAKQGKMREAIAAYEQALASTTDRQASLRDAIRQRLDAVRSQAK